MEMKWKSQHGVLDLAQNSAVMGILNVTPDSFSDQGSFVAFEGAMAQARRMIAEGASIIDIGGESTRPGAAAVSADEEMARILPVLIALRAEWSGWISIDTQKASVARAALAAGATAINDVSGLTADQEMIDVVHDFSAAVIVMHMQGVPSTMQENPQYQDVRSEVRNFFQERFASLIRHGVDPECVCFDPGIGFGKSLEHNLSLLEDLPGLSVAGRPILLGVSRKSLIKQLIGEDDMALRDAPTVALTAMARLQGVMLHRVHDVKSNRNALKVIDALCK